MSTADYDDAIEHYHLAQGAFLKGKPEPVKELWSHRRRRRPREPLWPAGARVGAGCPGDRACGVLTPG
jgi:hypothetical protein